MKAKTVKSAPADSLSRHRSIWELRADNWISLVDNLDRIATLARDHFDWEPCLARVRATVAMLEPIEHYWAFPGDKVFAQLATWIDRDEFARAHQYARRIHRMLAAQTYRHENTGLDSDTTCPRRSRPTSSAWRRCRGRTSRC